MTGDGTAASYRPNVGLMLIGPQRRVFVGHRPGMPNDLAWQMPQGGIDQGETPIEAAWRELGEEVGTRKALLLREARDWLTYEVPSAVAPAHWKGRWRGQRQKWFALAFTGTDEDIDIAAHGDEFDAWKWMPAGQLVEQIVAFKRPVYEAVVREFADLL
jgi:putative (di)nucleoside polyphosphate hydrolase